MVAADVFRTLTPQTPRDVTDIVRHVANTTSTGGNDAVVYLEQELQAWCATEQEAWQAQKDRLQDRYKRELDEQVLQLEQRCHDALEATVNELQAADTQRATSVQEWQH